MHLLFLLFFWMDVDSITTTTAYRLDSEQSIRIDGILDEDAWVQHPQKAKHRFLQTRPDVGKPTRFETEYAIYYDDANLYIALRMFDDEPHLIPRELSARDGFNVQSDMLAIGIDPYRRAQTGYGFFVSSSGVQSDALFLAGGGEDDAWNAVWESAVSIDEHGWVAELRIPFAAIRFPAIPVQEWGFMIYRVDRRINEESFFTPFDPTRSGLMTQFGVLKGIRDIKPPLRLELYPYASLVRSSYGSSNSSSGYNFGSDLRYGINEAFTLDLTLVPDFSQVRSDDQILNLSPFDIRYQENRPFFTEGTDLFDQNDLFYSRRIGQSYRGSGGLARDGETVQRSAEDPHLLNAFKITGRASNGVGVGFLNAVTLPTDAEYVDSLGNTRTGRVDPWMNFNIVSVDRTFGNRNRIGFMNTNVWRGDGLRKANVSLLSGMYYDASNTYRIFADGMVSTISDDGPTEMGYRGQFGLGKVSGRLTGGYEAVVVTETYAVNDFGFQNAPNFIEQEFELLYNRPDGKGPFQAIEAWLKTELEHRYRPILFNQFESEIGTWGRLKNNHSLFIWLFLRPFGQNDFFDSRQDGYILFRPNIYMLGGGYNSDNRKRIRFSLNQRLGTVPDWDQKIVESSLSTTFRVSDRISLSHQINRNLSLNQRGGFGNNLVNGEVLIGRRDLHQYTNTFTFLFNLSVKQSADLRVHHNWSRVDYLDYATLGFDRKLTPTATLPTNDPTTNFNFLSIDLNYQFQFAPGSFLNLNAKTNLTTRNEQVGYSFSENIQDVFDEPRFTSVSAKVIWFFNRW